MGQIWLTGDIHGEPYRLCKRAFPEQDSMTKEDFVIILGDFGIIWEPTGSKNERYLLKELSERSFTTLFIDGNHDNFDRYYSDEFLTVDFHDGKAQQISDSVYRLMRGEIYNLNGYSFFSMGGAVSHDIEDGILEIGDNRIKQWNKEDKMFRINHKTWWKEELPSEEELQHGLDTLAAHDWNCNFILSHSPATSQLSAFGRNIQPNILTDYLDEVLSKTDYDCHFFGHMHKNLKVNKKAICLYEQIVQII